MRITSALGVSMLLVACSSGGATASSTAPITSDRADDVSSPDALLQARLRRAVRELRDLDARKGPIEEYGLISIAPTSLGDEGLSPHKPPQLRMGTTHVNGRLPPEVIQRIVRQNFGRFRLCYEQGLKTDPNLAGTVSVHFTITSSGDVADVKADSGLPSASVTECVRRAFTALSFPQPEGGIVKVDYPIKFAPASHRAPVHPSRGRLACCSPGTPRSTRTTCLE